MKNEIFRIVRENVDFSRVFGIFEVIFLVLESEVNGLKTRFTLIYKDFMKCHRTDHRTIFVNCLWLRHNLFFKGEVWME